MRDDGIALGLTIDRLAEVQGCLVFDDPRLSQVSLDCLPELINVASVGVASPLSFGDKSPIETVPVAIHQHFLGRVSLQRLHWAANLDEIDGYPREPIAGESGGPRKDGAFPHIHKRVRVPLEKLVEHMRRLADLGKFLDVLCDIPGQGKLSDVVCVCRTNPPKGFLQSRGIARRVVKRLHAEPVHHLFYAQMPGLPGVVCRCRRSSHDVREFVGYGSGLGVAPQVGL